MEFPLQVRGLLIDMDGLLLDTERVSERCWAGAEEATGFRMPDGFYHTLIGQSMTCIRGRLVEVMDPDCDVEAFLSEASRIYTEALTREPVPVKRGARSFLELISKRDIPRCLATSTGTDLCRHKLESSDLAQYLPLRVCGDEVEHSKPAPDIYSLAARRLGRDPADLLVLEDSENGLRAAMAAGCRTAHIPDLGPVALEVQARADRVYRDLLELVEAIRREEIRVLQ